MLISWAIYGAHWNWNVVILMKLFTTSSTANDDNFVKNDDMSIWVHLLWGLWREKVDDTWLSGYWIVPPCPVFPNLCIMATPGQGAVWCLDVCMCGRHSHRQYALGTHCGGWSRQDTWRDPTPCQVDQLLASGEKNPLPWSGIECQVCWHKSGWWNSKCYFCS